MVGFIWGIYNKLYQKAKTITDFSPVFNVNISGLLIYFTIKTPQNPVLAIYTPTYKKKLGPYRQGP